MTNLMLFIVDAVREYAMAGEISDVFREVCGVYRDPACLWRDEELKEKS